MSKFSWVTRLWFVKPSADGDIIAKPWFRGSYFTILNFVYLRSRKRKLCTFIYRLILIRKCPSFACLGFFSLQLHSICVYFHSWPNLVNFFATIFSYNFDNLCYMWYSIICNAGMFVLAIYGNARLTIISQLIAMKISFLNVN